MLGLSRGSFRGIAIALAVAASVLAPLLLIENPRIARSAAIVAVYLVLALTEVVPAFVPLLVLLVATPIALAALSSQYELAAVLAWPADPVLALFAGGLALGLAAHRHGVDAVIAQSLLRIARNDRRALLALVSIGTALMSMWMSNIAAAAMVLAALRPLLRQETLDDPFRRALLLGVAVGANLGGLATPIGTGPNAIAIAAVENQFRITFMHWMAFALPLVLALLLLALLFLVLRYRVHGDFELVTPTRPPVTPSSIGVIAVFGAAVLAWLSEPLHGLSAPLVSLAVALALFGTGLLRRDDLGALDWATLGLIAGGISLGKLIEHSQIFAQLSDIAWASLPRVVWLGGLVFTSALLSAIMSNTATAALLIPLALSIDPAPSTSVVIAVGCSLGMPFAISTPPNAMAYGEGSLRTGDLAWLGGLLMLVGCALVTLTGGAVLQFMGVP